MAASFGSFGPAGPGFGSIQNAPATGVNPTAFPTAPPSSVGSGGLAPGGLGGLSSGGLSGAAGSQGGLGNMVGAQVSPLSQGPAPQPYRAPLPLPPPAAAAPAAAPAAAAATPGNPNFMAAAQADFLAGSPAGQSNLYALGYGPGGSVRPGSQAAQYGGTVAGGAPWQPGSLFGLGGLQSNSVPPWQGMGSGNGGAAGNGSCWRPIKMGSAPTPPPCPQSCGYKPRPRRGKTLIPRSPTPSFRMSTKPIHPAARRPTARQERVRSRTRSAGRPITFQTIRRQPVFPRQSSRSSIPI